jgi:hypothetical protein
MGLLDDLAPPLKVLPCKVREVANTLSDKDASIFTEAVMNPEWGCTTLSNALSERGLSISDKAIKRHRTNVCSCRLL